MNNHWVGGNRITLLENGDAFFPRVFACIAAAEREVLLETFILFDDQVGRALHAALLTAARRGVRIDVTVDGYGSPDLSGAFISALTQAGVRFHVFDPRPRLWGYRTNLFRRMHRKIVVIDGARAFVGGINYSDEQLTTYGPGAKQDYTIEVEGPLLPQIRHFVRTQLLIGQRARPRLHQRLFQRVPQLESEPAPAAGNVQALFVTRDNNEHKNDIERHYRMAIRGARRRIIIANAYFFPGYRLLNQLRQAARRGVDVSLILQGAPDMPIAKVAARLLYHHLLVAGIKIYEYQPRALHGKVALTDEEWSTVGSSNLDPLSLSLNLEANVIIKDQAFNQMLGQHLVQLMQHDCTQIRAGDVAETGLWARLRSLLVFHLLRRYPAWFGWLPAHRPRLTPSGNLLPETELLPEAGSDRLHEGRAS